MANPSLQIGNDNWAIKEDNLLGYSTAGTRFVPQPITMTRASAGTRVNSSGLVETVELLGSEEVTNGEFETRSNWTFLRADYDVTTNPNKATITNSSINGYIYNTVAIPTNIGSSYNVKVNYYGTLSTILGTNPVVKYDNVGGGGSVYGSRTITSAAADELIDFNFVATTSVFWVSLFSPTNADIHVWGNISVKESTKNNLARVDYTDGTSSLLAEPMRTNLITYSSDFTDSSWVNVGGTVTTNDATSPDGTLNASSIEIASGGYVYFTHSATISIGDKYTWSCFVKSSDTKINWGGGTPDGTDIYTIEDFGNGWYRQVLQRTFTTAGVSMQVMFAEGIAGTDLFYIYGASLEVGSYPTSYIPTDGGTVTRVQDQYSKTGISDLINSEEGVLFAEMAALSDDSDSKRITISDGTLTNRITISIASNIISGFINVNNVTQYTFYESGITTTDFNKIAIKFKENDFAIWINGVEYDVDTSGITFSADTLNTLNFSNATNLSNFFNGKVKQLQVYTEALSDTQLAALTQV